MSLNFKYLGQTDVNIVGKNLESRSKMSMSNLQLSFGRGSIFVWRCFTSRGIGYLCKIDGGLDAELYRRILKEDFMETFQYYELNVSNIIFQQNNDLKQDPAYY